MEMRGEMGGSPRFVLSLPRSLQRRRAMDSPDEKALEDRSIELHQTGVDC